MPRRKFTVRFVESVKTEVSWPVEFHHQPLSEPGVTLSRHTAPIRRTCRSCQAANARRDARFVGPTFAESGSRGSCEL
jgi:hypothetical protein